MFKLRDPIQAETTRAAEAPASEAGALEQPYPLRIEITEEEILADLTYPADPPRRA